MKKLLLIVVILFIGFSIAGFTHLGGVYWIIIGYFDSNSLHKLTGLSLFLSTIYIHAKYIITDNIKNITAYNRYQDSIISLNNNKTETKTNHVNNHFGFFFCCHLLK